ncbi:hypothetical protein Cni_G24821 [Canna indica]|uniref:AMP-dependent synthetase/ligase domain-containing protein n=1 Tax=Canna indica TaxID=4628 RepID=A0AAQ3KWK4_9LILI|nr:hypothetical protein Cni_G24821 [Canna indica]
MDRLLKCPTNYAPLSPSPSCRGSRQYTTTAPPSSTGTPSQPLESLPLFTIAFAFSLLPSSLPSHPAIIDAATSAFVSYTDFVARVRSLATTLCSRTSLSKGGVSFVIAPSGIDIPVLYFALLSIGVVVSPVNALSTPDEITHQIRLSNPSIAFATTATASKLPPNLPTILLGSPHFRSLFASTEETLPLPKLCVDHRHIQRLVAGGID